MTTTVVDRATDLLIAVETGVEVIEIAAPIGGLPPLALSRGQTIIGKGAATPLSFVHDGLSLSGTNSLKSLHINCPATASAINVAPGATECGSFHLSECQCEGVVHLVFDDNAGDVTLAIAGIAVTCANATALLPRPAGNGVEVQQGALTVWNRSVAPTVVTLVARDIVIGSSAQPVGGTGLFVAGNQSGKGGTISLHQLETGPIFSDSMLPEGTTGIVAGGIFLLAGVNGEWVETLGDIVTWGANSVPIDTWGLIGHWRIDGNARSHGPSAVGMVNAGTLERCTINGEIETFGDGARGCCIYGPTGTITARAIRTHGSAAAGLHVVDQLDAIILTDGVFTAGAPGQGLMKGRMIETPAHGVEVETSGRLGVLDCARIAATGAGAEPIHAEPGAIGTITDHC